MLMEHLEHLDHNGVLGVHGACDRGMNLMRMEWIARKRNGSSDKGTNLRKAGLDQLRVFWRNLEQHFAP